MIRYSSKEAVVLLHGLAAHRFVMVRLARHLRGNGFWTENWGYRSIRPTIEFNSLWFKSRFNDFVSRTCFDRVHLVTHSMGSIIARRALDLERPHNLGRFVMLGPPNSGSHVARRLSAHLSRLCPPLRELSDLPDSYVNRLNKPAGIELGIIAAESDRVVRLNSTFLDCQRDHIVLPGHHGTLLWRRDTSEQVIHFLQKGRFRHDSQSTCVKEEQLDLVRGKN